MLKERLHTILQEQNILLSDFAEMCDLPFETVRNVYYGRTSDPKVSTVMKMAQALNISVNCLMGSCSHSKEEKVLLRHYRSCGTHGKSIIELIAKYEAISARAEREAYEKHKIPCLIPKGNICQGIIYDSCETVEIFTSEEKAYTAIQITNNELVPVYCKGDIVLIENRFPTNGEYGAFFKNDRAYIRQYIEEDGVYILRCIHRQGKDIVLERMDQIEYIGTCIGVVRS